MWAALKDELLEQCQISVDTDSSDNKELKKCKFQEAKAQKNPWKAFQCIEECLSSANFYLYIKNRFEKAQDCEVPDIYKSFWKLGIDGIITTNVDGFCERAFHSVHTDASKIDFLGINVHQNMGVLRDTPRFIANIHGKHHSSDSLVFTQAKLNSILINASYKKFMQSIFLGTTVVFVGATADDLAIKYHIDSIINAGIDISGHYWITSDNDADSIRWASESGIHVIKYKDNNNHHQLKSVFQDFQDYVAQDVDPEPIYPESVKSTRNLKDFSPDEVRLFKPNEIRKYLNKRAVKILSSNAPDKEAKYKAFCEQYDESIHSSWYIKVNERFFNYTVEKIHRQGPFGVTYKVVNDEGENFALKLMHGHIRDEDEKINCFRRGTQSMRILTKNKIEGMVPMIDAWEIPTSILMEFVEGGDLSEAVAGRIVESWDERLHYALEIANALINAHELDAQVLHRDISPKNILLEDLYSPEESTHIKIADFDLSWHKDADDTSIAFDVMNGYLAPEQLDMTRRKQCRNAYVDSFGFGMTLYFMLSNMNPNMGEHKDKITWRDKLIRSASHTQCRRWLSLPRRFARMIYFLTKDVQEQRWTMQEARNELVRLQSTFQGIQRVNSAELFAEELIHRTKGYSNQYYWDKYRLCAEIEIRSGFNLHICGDEAKKRVIINVDWAHLGDAQLSTIQKYLPNKVKSIVGSMNKRGWISDSISFAGGSTNYSLELPISKLKSVESLNETSSNLEDLIEAHRIR